MIGVVMKGGEGGWECDGDVRLATSCPSTNSTFPSPPISSPGSISPHTQPDTEFPLWTTILLANSLQLVFDMILLFTLKVTFKPTPLEVLYKHRHEGDLFRPNVTFKPTRIRQIIKSLEESEWKVEEEFPLQKVVKRLSGELIVLGMMYVSLHWSVVGVRSMWSEGMCVDLVRLYVWDQVKSVVVQPVLWWVLVRRCGSVEGSFEEWDDVQVSLGLYDASLLTLLQDQVRAFLHLSPTVTFLTILTKAYSVFLLLDFPLTFFSLYPPALLPYTPDIHLTALFLFTLELLLQVFSHFHDYFTNFRNIIDFTVVLVPFLLHLTGRNTTLTPLILLTRVFTVNNKSQTRQNQASCKSQPLYPQDNGVK